MYREPEKFKDMNSSSDVFHGWSGHVCGPLYCSKYCKEVDPQYYELNTSLVESNNNIVQRMNVSAIWMNLDTFNLYMTQMLEFVNRQEIRKQQGRIVF
jgi:hypothetical protein